MQPLSKKPHTPVMLAETLDFFKNQTMKSFFEGTVGAGGHAKAILEAHPEIERYFACDRDLSALEIAKETLKPWKGKVEFIHGNFSDLDRYLKERGVQEVDGFFLIWGSRRCKSTEVRGDLALVKRGL